MNSSLIETKYPLSFRKQDAESLGEHLRLRHSVEIVGVKRVGISDFLRFFLNRHGVVQKYIDRANFHLFVAVDINDLIEREVYPFWILTLKRINDAVDSFDVNANLKREISALFLSSIQTGDLFLTIENTRVALQKIVEAQILPTIFFIRFDRIINVLGPEFFANLESLIDVSNNKLAFVFTSFRKIDELTKEDLPRNFLHVFSNIIYIKPANFNDSKIILDAFKSRYGFKVSGNLERRLIGLSGGHVQYLHLLLLLFMQKGMGKTENILDLAILDERISLQSEEMWESLRVDEQKILMKIFEGEGLLKKEYEDAKYAVETGILKLPYLEKSVGFGLHRKTQLKSKGTYEIFSPLFIKYVSAQIAKGKNNDETVELTKKENALYNFLFENLNNVCEREKIIEAVWPEEEELGVSDWTVDRLVARLRDKLKQQESIYQIVTVKTRGFKLVK